MRVCQVRLPIPLRLLLAVQPKQVTPVLRVVHRVITRFLLDQAGLKAGQADSGAVTLMQRFGSAANLNIRPFSQDALFGAGRHAPAHRRWAGLR